MTSATTPSKSVCVCKAENPFVFDERRISWVVSYNLIDKTVMYGSKREAVRFNDLNMARRVGCLCLELGAACAFIEDD